MQELNQTLMESMATLQYGLIEEIDDANYLVKVKIEVLDDLVTDWLPVMTSVSQDDQDYHLPDEGTQVALLLDPTGTDGIVLGAVYSEVDAPPVGTRDKWHRKFKDGTTIEYDRAAHKLTVDAKGEIQIDATGPIKVKGNQAVTVEGQTMTLKALTVTIEAQTIAKIEAPVAELDTMLTKTGPMLVEGLLQFVPPS